MAKIEALFPLELPSSFVVTIWAMLASTLAAITPLQVVAFLEYDIAIVANVVVLRI